MCVCMCEVVRDDRCRQHPWSTIFRKIRPPFSTNCDVCPCALPVFPFRSCSFSLSLLLPHFPPLNKTSSRGKKSPSGRKQTLETSDERACMAAVRSSTRQSCFKNPSKPPPPLFGSTFQLGKGRGGIPFVCSLLSQLKTRRRPI